MRDAVQMAARSARTSQGFVYRLHGHRRIKLSAAVWKVALRQCAENDGGDVMKIELCDVTDLKAL